MSKKSKNPDLPVAICGRVVLEFFGNDDEHFKLRSLEQASKEIRKEFNASCVPIEENWMENPERGTLVLSLCSPRVEKAKVTVDQILKYLDSHVPARIVLEEFEEVAIATNA